MTSVLISSLHQKSFSYKHKFCVLSLPADPREKSKTLNLNTSVSLSPLSLPKPLSESDSDAVKVFPKNLDDISEVERQALLNLEATPPSGKTQINMEIKQKGVTPKL